MHGNMNVKFDDGFLSEILSVYYRMWNLRNRYTV